MPLEVAGLVLASALLHALWNAVLKREPDPEVASVAIVAIAVGLSAAAAPLVPGTAFPAVAGLAWSAAAGVCEGGYFLTLALGLRLAPLGVVYTISRGGALLAVWPASVLLLGERVTAPAAAGAAAVLAGLVLVGLDRGGRAAPRGVASAVVCAAFIAGYHLCYKQALSAGAEPTAVFAVALGVALPVVIARLGRRSAGALAAIRARPLLLGAAGVLCAASFLIFLVALSRGGPGAVLTLRNTSVVFATILAWLLGERPGHAQVAGTLAVAAGAVVLGWPR